MKRPTASMESQNPCSTCYHEAGHAIVAFVHSVLPPDAVIAVNAKDRDGSVTLGKLRNLVGSMNALRCVAVAGEIASLYAVNCEMVHEVVRMSSRDFYLLEFAGAGDGVKHSRSWLKRWVYSLDFYSETMVTVRHYWPSIASVAELLHKKYLANYKDVQEAVVRL